MNSFKHGLTGQGVVLAEEDAAKVEELSRSFARQMKAQGALGEILARRMAIMSVRMDRAVEQETAANSARVQQVLEEFQAPEGVDAEEADRLRLQSRRMALFDPSRAAELARKYEAAAERCFFRSMKELRQLSKASSPAPVVDRAGEARAAIAKLGSFLQDAAPAPTPAPASVPAPAPAPVPASTPPPTTQPRPTKSNMASWDPFAPTYSTVPIAIGKPR